MKKNLGPAGFAWVLLPWLAVASGCTKDIPDVPGRYDYVSASQKIEAVTLDLLGDGTAILCAKNCLRGSFQVLLYKDHSEMLSLDGFDMDDFGEGRPVLAGDGATGSLESCVGGPCIFIGDDSAPFFRKSERQPTGLTHKIVSRTQKSDALRGVLRLP